jgi:hypothetical protein
MPSYEYRCPANGASITVYHPMGVLLRDWGSLCAVAGMEPGNTAPGSPVVRQLGAGVVIRRGAGGHGAGGCCGRRGCA